MDQKTVLYETHLKYKGQIVPFAGFLLPVQYEKGLLEEHLAVRNRVGLFDVSHMGEILIRGEDALNNLQMLLTNDFTNMEIGQARYSPMCNEKGGTVDDLIVYKKNENDYFVVVNASNIEKDFEWIKQHRFGNVEIINASAFYAQIAIQGPASEKVLRKMTPEASIPKKYYYAIFDGRVAEIPCIVSRTGYTGEDGFELYTENKYAQKLWEILMEAGAEEDILPCGLGARDTLRLEAAMPLYGHEMDDTISPLETGLGFAVKLDKLDFIGKKGIGSKESLTRKRVGLEVTGRGIIREHQEVFYQGKLVGTTTSGTHSPYLGYPIAMALIEIEAAEIGTQVEVMVRNRAVSAKVVKIPFYKKQ